MAEIIQHKRQQFDPGIVWLDDRNLIISMNGVATEVLDDRAGELSGSTRCSGTQAMSHAAGGCRRPCRIWTSLRRRTMCRASPPWSRFCQSCEQMD
jgi:hypothetical protein